MFFYLLFLYLVLILLAALVSHTYPFLLSVKPLVSPALV